MNIAEEMSKAIIANHIAYMGDDRGEINFSEKHLAEVRAIAGEEIYQQELDKYNEILRSM